MKLSGRVDWRAPDAKADALFGAGATRAEKSLANGVGIAGAVFIVLAAWVNEADWNILLYLVAAIIAFDVVGGVVANGLNAAKRDHFGPPSATERTALGRLVRHPVIFTSLHIHPIIVGTFYPPHLWWWGPLWYLGILAGTAIVRSVPLYLERPVALGFCALVAMVSAYSPMPEMWGWLPVMLALKLVLAHAVQEEPYRPAAPAAR
ncbi:hypothetical protein [Microbacterium yannicii]|uniref:hypothetical protein n=1 Tax=Microbacterium yannicii TaxID=671622 RepID=UPI0002FB4326|nr:hypothetical protein [Microbacterium yannicii]